MASSCSQAGGCEAGSPQETWLRADLAANTSNCVVAYWHHTRFSSSSGHGSDDRTEDLWQALYDAGADIINFDAFEFGETIAMYPESISEFLNQGRILAWGIVPTSIAVREQTVDSLAEHFEKLMDHLAGKCKIAKEIKGGMR